MKKLRTLFFILAILGLSVNGIYAQSTYVITGSGTSFTVVKDGTTTIVSGVNIYTAINGIQINTAGTACIIQFGNGAVLTLPLGDCIFLDGNWGEITLTGSLTTTAGSNPYALIHLNNTLSTEAPINFNATLTATGTERAIFNATHRTINITGGAINGTVAGYGTVNISGGTVSVNGGNLAAIDNCTGTVNISGGVVSSTGLAIGNGCGGGKTTISGTAQITSSGDFTIAVSAGDTLIITGGIIKNTNTGGNTSDIGSAIFNQNGQVKINGGMVLAKKGYAIYSNVSPNINGGIVFAYGTTDSDVISNSNYSLSGNGVIAAWNKDAGNNTYFSGYSEDIYKIPATATAMWATLGGVNGISVVNNTNTGFIPIDDITINSFVPVTDITGVPATTIKTFPLTLTGTVVPSNANNKTIVWSVQDAGTTGATIATGSNILNTTNSGTATVLATIVNGASPSQNFTKPFNISVTEIIPVTNITNVPSYATVNVPLTLTGTVVPANATFKTIVWSLVYGGTTNASVNSGVLYTSANGTAVVRATITNGKDIGTDYTQDFNIVVGDTPPATNISGTVFRPNQTALSSGEVSLYRVQTMTKYILIETVQIDNDGSFVFNNVSQGGYIVKAIAPPAEEMLPTYFGNSENWEQATLITVATVSISNIDITLKAAKKAPEGDSEINGIVIEDGGKRAGSPVEDVTVYLLSFENSIWTTIATTNTDAAGSFAFSKLAAGKYMTIVDAPGIKMLNSIPLDLAVTDTINILFTITDEGIETTIGNVGINSPTLPEIKVYPNPTTGELRIENGELRVKEVEIFDVVGKKVYTNHLITTSSNHLINISHLQAGVYFVRIQTEAGEVVRKVLKE